MISLFERIQSGLRGDPLLQRVVRNSSYLFSSNAIAAVLGFLQGIFVVRLLGVEGYGLVSGTIMLYASNVNRFLSFRMSEVVVKYVGEALAHHDRDRAAALVKGIGIAEALTSVLAYLVLLAISFWAAQKYSTSAYLFAFYGLFLLANLVYETSVGMLQTTDRFKLVGRANLFQSIATVTLIFTAFVLRWGIFEVLAAYLIGKTIAALLITSSAVRETNRRLGGGWTQVPLKTVSDWRSLARFALSTNLNGTVNLLARDNIPLYIGFFRPQVEVGYFKLALSLLYFVTLPIEPFIGPTYAEITRTVARRQWDATRRLLKQVSLITGAWTLAAGGGLIALGWWLIPLVYGADSAPTYPAFVILMFGYACANILSWNRPLLLALGRPSYPLVVAAVVGVLEVILIFLLVPHGSYLMGALIFAGYLIISIGWNVWRGLTLIHREETIS